MGTDSFSDMDNSTSAKFESTETRYYAQEADNVAGTMRYTSAAKTVQHKGKGATKLGIYFVNDDPALSFVDAVIEGRSALGGGVWNDITNLFTLNVAITNLASGASAYASWNPQAGPIPDEVRVGIKGALGSAVDGYIIFEVQ